MAKLYITLITLLFGYHCFAVPVEFESTSSYPTTTATGAPISDTWLDVLNLIPRDKITEIAESHLKDDQGFMAAIKYMQGDEWKNLVETVKSKSEWIKFKLFLKEFGLDLDVLIRCVDKFLANAHVDLQTRDPEPKRNLTAFIIEVEQNIPVLEIAGALQVKMKKPGFGELYMKMSSDESKKLVQDVLTVEEVKLMMKKLEEMGMNIHDLLRFMFIFLGWNDIQM